MTAPIVKWFEGTNHKDNEIKDKVDFGRVDADTISGSKTFYIWNNHNGSEDLSKMEEVTFTTRDRLGGTGDTVGNIVEAVRDNWFNVRVDSLDDTGFTPVGKIGNKPVGTNGTTISPYASTAVAWTTATGYNINNYVKPTVDNGFIYRVVKDGTTGAIEPTWSLVDGETFVDGTVEFIAVKINRQAGANEILGAANSVLDDGSNASDAGANFVKLTVYADVPVNASAGKNLLVQRVSYRSV